MSRNRVQAGKYRYPATIQKRQMGQDGYGSTTQDWITVLNARVGVFPISGREFFEQHVENPELTHKVYMRYIRNTVTPDMRILYDGRTFLIHSVIDYQERHTELQLICKELIENE
jgi:SPP1 family predicted phage head-tail adaptor